MQQSKKMNKEERLDFVIGVVAVVIATLLAALLIAGIANAKKGMSTRNAGEISAEGAGIRGTEQTYTYIPNGEISDGTPVIWTVDGEIVQQDSYSKDKPVTLHYVHNQAGAHKISATVGISTQNYTAEIESPVLTLTAPSVTITYGDELPELLPAAEGFVADENCDFRCEACTFDGEVAGVGVYRVIPKSCDFLDYKTECVEGTLTVLPRELSVVGTLTKRYDGTNFIENPEIEIEGVLTGDDVSVQCDKLYLENKNAGTKNALLSTACLVGDDAANYVLPDFATATVIPRALVLNGLKVQNKLYDGTTKTTIEQMGTLEGVCAGDSVAIGKISTRFDGSEVGDHSVIVDSITLVGADKGNYVVIRADIDSAKIQEKVGFWDKLLQKERVAQG